MSKIVAMLGVIGAGKDYRTNKLVEQGYVRIDFGDAIREMTWNILGWKPENEKEYEEFKKVELDFTNQNTFEEVKYPIDGGLTGRKFLQNLGKTMTDDNPMYWAQKWEDKVKIAIQQKKNIVTSDCRRLLELKTINNYTNSSWGLNIETDTEFIFCDYHSERYEPNNPHSSERLAQRILKDGLKDGDILPTEYIEKLISE